MTLKARPPVIFLIILFWSCAALILAPRPLQAGNENPDPALEEPAARRNFIDSTQLFIARTVDGTVKRFDRFFLSDREQVESSYSYLTLRNNFVWEESEGVTYQARLKAKIRVPGLQRRLHIIFESDDEAAEEKTTQDLILLKDEQVKAPADERNRAIGLQYNALKRGLSRLDLELRFLSELEPELSTRFRRKHMFGRWFLFRFTETGFWRGEGGFGERTQIDFERALSPNKILTWANKGTYAEFTTGLEWVSQLSLAWIMSSRRAMVFGAGVFGRTRPQKTANNYVINTVYRQRIWRDWLFYEIEPVVSFPRGENGFGESVPALVFRIEVQFKEYK